MRRQGQEGFTLIELVLAIAIAGAIVTVVGMTITTLILNSQQPSRQYTLLPQVQNAGYWISRDVQMSRNVTAPDPSGFPLSISIPVDDDENNDYDIKYAFSGNTLIREVYDSSGNLTSQNLIAKYVDKDITTFDSDNTGASLYKLTIRAVMGEEAVTASYEMRQRLIAN